MSAAAPLTRNGERTKSLGYAVVTGASAGLGAEFARQLAARGYDLVLTARRRDRLEALAADLRAKHGIETLVVECDLSRHGGPAQLVAALDAKKITPSLLVNNAGFGVHGVAIEVPAARQLEILDLNMRALTELSIVLGARMAERGEGAIINVASTAAFQPTAYFAAYAATKAYVLSFTQALSFELAPRGVRVLAHCPGATRTEFFEAGDVNIHVLGALYMSAERCVRIALRALDGGRRVVITGWINAIGAWLARISPQAIVLAASSWLMRPVKPALPATKR